MKKLFLIYLGIVFWFIHSYAFANDFDGDKDIDGLDLGILNQKYITGELNQSDLEKFSMNYSKNNIVQTSENPNPEWLFCENFENGNGSFDRRMVLS